MEKKKNVSKQSSNSLTVKKILRTFKKKPLTLITPLMGIVIIILAILLITSNASRQADASSQNADTGIAEGTEAENTAPVYSYDESKWIKKLQTGFLVYDDEDYVCTTGIDVSEWSLDIDWEKVKSAGIEFAIMRVGYRGYGTGKFQFDEKLEEYLTGAEAAGIKTGVYFVTQAVDENEAIEEAETVMEKIKGHDITLPIYIDCEANTGEETRTDKLTREQFTKNAIAFCKRVEEAGYRGGVYSNDTWISKNLDISQLTDFDIWFAKYTDTPQTDIPFQMWQYSASGSIDGITTAADLNLRIEKK